MFTQQNDKEDIIIIDIAKISEELAEEETVALFGSYAKGEGGLLDGKPVNDYDLIIYTEDREDFEKIAYRIGSLGLNNLPEMHHLKPSEIENLKCTQQWYEASIDLMMLSGKKAIPFPYWEAHDIPYLDAINSLERRAVSMLIAKHEMLKGEDTDWNKVMGQIGKMVIALGDAILIKRGVFNTSYRTRALMLGQDDISELYNTAVSYKLLSLPDLSKDKIWEYWNITRNYYYRYVKENQIPINVGNALLAIDETISKDKLKELIIKLNAGSWL